VVGLTDESLHDRAGNPSTRYATACRGGRAGPGLNVLHRIDRLLRRQRSIVECGLVSTRPSEPSSASSSSTRLTRAKATSRERRSYSAHHASNFSERSAATSSSDTLVSHTASALDAQGPQRPRRAVALDEQFMRRASRRASLRRQAVMHQSGPHERCGPVRSARCEITLDHSHQESEGEEHIIDSHVRRLTRDVFAHERSHALDRGDLLGIVAGEASSGVERPLEGIREGLEEQRPIEIGVSRLSVSHTPLLAGGSDMLAVRSVTPLNASDSAIYALLAGVVRDPDGFVCRARSSTTRAAAAVPQVGTGYGVQRTGGRRV
jgi:hypothetical protein